MGNPVYESPTYRKARKSLLRHGALCAHCGAPAVEADHQPPLSRHHHVEASGCCRLVGSCFRCGREQGGVLAGRKVNGTPRPGPQVRRAVEPVGWPADDAMWDRPWLAVLRQVPDGATWPRLMTPPHPAAVDSWGDRFCEYARKRCGHELRWWQRLAATRLLEHDDAGMLCWDAAGITVARQVGKSWLLRELALWRLHQGGLFGEPQDIVHTAKDLAICVEVQGPGRRWARQLPERYKVLESHGSEQVQYLEDGSRWLVRAYGSPYGWSASMTIVDEAWAVPTQDIEEGLLPTMVERSSPQLVMFSTAHRKATTLMLGRRAAVLADLADTSQLWLEWSAPAAAEPDDENGWKAASPHWSQPRRKLIAGRLAAARSGQSDDPTEPDPWVAFTTQWLNRWPTRSISGRGEPILDPDVWEGCFGQLDRIDPAVTAVAFEIHDEQAAVGFVAGDGNGRFEVDGYIRESWEKAFDAARWFAATHDQCRIVLGAGLKKQLPDDFPGRDRAVKAGTTEVQRSFPLLRALAAECRVFHDGTTQLDEQLARVRVWRTPAGGLSYTANGPPHHLINAVLFALDAAQTHNPAPAVH